MTAWSQLNKFVLQLRGRRAIFLLTVLNTNLENGSGKSNINVCALVYITQSCRLFVKSQSTEKMYVDLKSIAFFFLHWFSRRETQSPCVVYSLNVVLPLFLSHPILESFNNLPRRQPDSIRAQQRLSVLPFPCNLYCLVRQGVTDFLSWPLSIFMGSFGERIIPFPSTGKSIWFRWQYLEYYIPFHFSLVISHQILLAKTLDVKID